MPTKRLRRAGKEALGWLTLDRPVLNSHANIPSNSSLNPETKVTRLGHRYKPFPQGRRVRLYRVAPEVSKPPRRNGPQEESEGSWYPD